MIKRAVKLRTSNFQSLFSENRNGEGTFYKRCQGLLDFFRTVLFVALLCLGLSAQADDKQVAEEPLNALMFSPDAEKDNESRAVKAEVLISKSENLALKQIGRLLKKYRGTTVEAGLWFRLSELYMRKAKAAKFFEWKRKSSGALKFSAPQIKKASSKRWVRKAIAVYEKMARKFRKFEKMDVVLFNNAFARQSLGQDSAAAKRYKLVIDRYPYSVLVPDSHLAIGEAAFDKKRFTVAIKHFEAIKKYPNSPVYPYGLYKSAWSFYNLGNSKKALRELESVIKYGKIVKKKRLDARLDLRTEALADMTIFFEDVYAAKKALPYFMEQSAEIGATPYLMRLVSLYKRHSKFKQAGVVLKALINDQFESLDTPEVYEEIVHNFESQRNRKGAVIAMQNFAELCRDGSDWLRHQRKRESKNYSQILKSCRDRMDDISLLLGQKWLRMWKKNPDYSIFAQSSEQAFKIYLYKKTPSKLVNQTRFTYAELLFNLKQFRLSSFEYETISKATKSKDKLNHASLYAAILSMEKAVGKKKWSDEDELRFNQLVDRYLAHHKKGKYVLGISFKKALIAYDKGKYKLAKPIFKNLGEKFGSKDEGKKSQDLYLDILNLQKEYGELKVYANSLRKRGGSKDRVIKLTKIFEEAYLIEVQSAVQKGKKKEAIKGYKNFVRENPKSKLVEKAWWNAVALHFEIRDIHGGAKASLEFYDRFPDSKLALEALKKAADTFQILGQFRQSADIILKIAKLDTKLEEKWTRVAADLYYIEGRWNKAKALYKKQLKSKDKTEITRSLLKLSEISKVRGRIDYKILGKIAATNQQPEASLAQLQILELEFKKKKYTQAFQTARKIVAMKRGAKSARAKARFIQGNILEFEFRKQSMRSNINRFTLVLALKTEKLDKAQRAYQAAIGFGDPGVGVQSLIKLSSCYGHYASALSKMPPPTGMDPAEVAGFKSEMGKYIFPMEERSVESLNEAYITAKRLKLRDGTIETLRQALKKLQISVPEGPMFTVGSPGVVVPRVAKKLITIGGL